MLYAGKVYFDLTLPPNGDNGIAAKYPGDIGIDQDPEVLFSDDFESYSVANDLRKKWDAARHEFSTRISCERENVHSGEKALEFTVPQREAELSNTVIKELEEEVDVLFLRYYSKFEKGFDQTRSSHNGGHISGHYYSDGRATPGKPADGSNKFLANFENRRRDENVPSPGFLAVYCYHPEQRSEFGDNFHPSGNVLPFSHREHPFGSEFISRADMIPELDRWYCFEYMLQANTVGERDGRITCWLDGEIVADFPNMRFRDVESLKIDRFGVNLHIGHNIVRENKKWYDDLVAATSYIGPMTEKM